MRPRALALLLLASGCASSGVTRGVSSDGTVAAADDARALYEAAYLQFRDGDCLEAEPKFRRVRREFAHSRYAALADLRIGDCQMQNGAHTEAIQSFQSFVRFRSTHVLVPYARFRIAEAHFEQIPTDWFLAPPSHERDLGDARDALKHLRRFLLDYPSDDNVPAARRMAQRALDVLADHELFAARFYDHRDAPTGVAMRLERLLYLYEGASCEPEALDRLADAYAALGRDEDAARTREALRTRHPDSPEARRSR